MRVWYVRVESDSSRVVLPLMMDLTITNCIFAFWALQRARTSTYQKKRSAFLRSCKRKMRICYKITFLSFKFQSSIKRFCGARLIDVDRAQWLQIPYKIQTSTKLACSLNVHISFHIFGFSFCTFYMLIEQNTTSTALHFLFSVHFHFISPSLTGFIIQ